MQYGVRRTLGTIFVVGTVLALLATPSLADEDPTGSQEPDDPIPMDEDDASPGSGSDGAAGSNPLASVSKVDLIWQHMRRRSGSDRDMGDFGLYGSTMVHERVKLNLELHYAYTDITGSHKRDWQSLHVKPIWFVLDKPLGDTWGMRVAAGGEYVRDFNK